MLIDGNSNKINGYDEYDEGLEVHLFLDKFSAQKSIFLGTKGVFFDKFSA